jgi:glucose-1-phosphate adenylyltransferase
MTNNIVILAGGASSRMKKSVDQNLSPEKIAQANQLSKGLIELRGKPFLSYLLENILKAGFENVYIITGENSKMFRQAF